HYIFVKLGKHAALLLEIGRKLRVGVQAISNLPVVPGPAEALRRNRSHHVQPTRGYPLRSQEAAEDSARGEGIPGQVDDVVVEGPPGIVRRLNVHGAVIVEEVEWEGEHAVGSLVIQVERRGPAECGEQRIGRKSPWSHLQESLGEL